MADVHAAALYGTDYCPYCSHPPAHYIYHMSSNCPKLEQHFKEQEGIVDALKFSMPRLASIGINLPQPTPQQNDEPIVWDLVIRDMHERDEKGVQKYHTHLQPFNGRDALIDAYQEALDLVVYLRQLIYEKYKE